MAGDPVLSKPTLARPPLRLRMMSACLSPFNREIAAIEVEGRNFYAMVPKGSAFNEKLERITEKYGGGIGTLHYEGMGDEIVVVRIGDVLLVKGEPDKVKNAEFRAFGQDPEQLREISVEKACDSKGGLHIFLGKTGIPIALDKDGKPIFLGGDEIKCGGILFSLQLVDYNQDPKTLSELSGDKKLDISDKAREIISSLNTGASEENISQNKLAQAHGGARGDKLIIDEQKMLIYDFQSGQLSAVSEFADRTNGFRAPQFDTMTFAHPGAQFTNIGLVYDTQSGPVNLPMDGSIHCVPYLYVKIFDGKVEDALRMRTSAALEKQLQEFKTERSAIAEQKREPVIATIPFQTAEFGKVEKKKAIDEKKTIGVRNEALARPHDMATRAIIAKIESKRPRKFNFEPLLSGYSPLSMPKPLIKAFSAPRMQKPLEIEKTKPTYVLGSEVAIPKPNIRIVPNAIVRQGSKITKDLSSAAPPKRKRRKKPQMEIAPKRKTRLKIAHDTFKPKVKPAKARKVPKVLQTRNAPKPRPRKTPKVIAPKAHIRNPRTRTRKISPFVAAKQAKRERKEIAHFRTQKSKRKEATPRAKKTPVRLINQMLHQWKRRGRKLSSRKKSVR